MSMSSIVPVRPSVRMIFSFCLTSSLLYALAAVRSKSVREAFTAKVMPESRSTSDAAMKPLVSEAIFSSTSVSCFSLAIGVPFLVSSSNAQVFFHRCQLVAGHRQVAAGLVQHQVDEQRVVAGEWPDQVILTVEGDQDVLDGVLEVQGFHRLPLGAHHLGVAGRGDLQVDRTRAAVGAQHHPAVAVDDTGAQCPVELHDLRQ